ncbi:MAG TPA: DUF4340 domain-containing protein [Verrucomicrobiae bacterium]|nr:DUF4340 domain-containing protein [Verrucomicrobiae bacterium]
METQTDIGSMNRKQFIILIVLVVVIGGAAWRHHHDQTASWNNSNPQLGGKLLGNFQVNDVAQIRIAQGENEVVLLKTNDLWRVGERGNYPADFSKISQFLIKLGDLKIVQTMEAGPSQWARLDLATSGQGTNSATVLEFFDASGKPIQTLLLGKNHIHESQQVSTEGENENWPDGRYVLTSTNSTTVAVISDALSEVSSPVSQWLDKTFFKVEKPQSISVNYPAATNSWELFRDSETNDWKLTDAKPDEKLDDSQTSIIANALSSPNFNDVAIDLKPAQTGLDKPTRVEIKTLDGFDYSINVGLQTNDNYYFALDKITGTFPMERQPEKDEKPQDKTARDKAFQDNLKKLQDKLAQESALTNWIYEVPGWSLDSLLKKRSQLLVAKPAATETNAPTANTTELSKP